MNRATVLVGLQEEWRPLQGFKRFETDVPMCKTLHILVWGRDTEQRRVTLHLHAGHFQHAMFLMQKPLIQYQVPLVSPASSTFLPPLPTGHCSGAARNPALLIAPAHFPGSSSPAPWSQGEGRKCLTLPSSDQEPPPLQGMTGRGEEPTQDTLEKEMGSKKNKNKEC